METFQFETIQGKLSLICLDVVEPNNGRMLYKVKLTLNDIDITASYFGTWNYINCHLRNYSSTSIDKKWFYIPKEGNHFLIHSETLQKEELPYLSVSAVTFKGNYFTENHLIVFSSEEIISKSLGSNKVCVLKQKAKEVYFQDITLLDATKLVLSLSDNTSQIVWLDTLQALE